MNKKHISIEPTGNGQWAVYEGSEWAMLRRNLKRDGVFYIPL